MRKVFQDERQIPSTLLAQVQRSRLKVELCEKCSSLNQSFSKLYRQLEKLEFGINSSLSLIQKQLLDSSQSDKHERKQFPKDLISPMKTELSQIVDVLRKEAVQKCSKKLRVLSSPRVKIKKLTKKQIDAELSKHPTNFGITVMENSIEFVEHIKSELESTNEDLLSDDDGINYDMDSEEMDEDEHASTAATAIAGRRDGDSINDKNLRNENSTATISTTATSNIEVSDGKYSRNPKTGRWKCSDCPVELSTKPSIVRHYRSVHLKVRYRCALCEKDFAHQADYNRHHRSVHVGIKFKCQVCNKLFSQKGNLRTHQRVGGCKQGTG